MYEGPAPPTGGNRIPPAPSRQSADRPAPRSHRPLGGRDGDDRDGRGGRQRPRRLRRHGRRRGGTGGSGRCPDGGFGAASAAARRLRRRRQDAPLAPQGRLLRRPARQGLRRPHDRARSQSFQQQPRPPRRTASSGKRTRKKIVKTMPKSVATWYGMLHSQTACGVTPAHRSTIGVAHRNLPCGTKVTLEVPRPLRPGPGDRPRPVHEAASAGTSPRERPKAAPLHEQRRDPRRPDQEVATRPPKPPRGGSTGPSGPAAARRRSPSGSGTR